MNLDFGVGPNDDGTVTIKLGTQIFKLTWIDVIEVAADLVVGAQVAALTLGVEIPTIQNIQDKSYAKSQLGYEADGEGT